MGRRNVIYESVYQKIAVEIAQRIADGEYKVGEKINARSTLAANYHVSPETARKAVNLLIDLDIMSSRQGSGTYVKSREKAGDFLKRYKNVSSIREIRRQIEESVRRQQEEMEKMEELLDGLLERTKRSRAEMAFTPYELVLPEGAACIGASIGELNIWQQTGATIVAVLRGDTYVISPGPYERLCEGDILYFVGDELANQRMINLFGSSGEEKRDV